MPNWDEIKKSIGKIADKTASKTRELTDTASLKIKIANKESERDLEYKRLGRLAYIRLRQTEGAPSEELAEKISNSLEKLDNIHKELSELQATDKARRDAKEAEKKAREDEKAEAEKKMKENAEALDLSVMEQFNDARRVADDEYEKAKQAAEDTKGEN